MITVMYNNHVIEVNPQASIFGKEVVKYDGKIVSQKNSITGGTHSFAVMEAKESVQYDIEIGMQISFQSLVSITVRRNGKVIFTNK